MAAVPAGSVLFGVQTGRRMGAVSGSVEPPDGRLALVTRRRHPTRGRRPPAIGQALIPRSRHVHRAGSGGKACSTPMTRRSPSTMLNGNATLSMLVCAGPSASASYHRFLARRAQRGRGLTKIHQLPTRAHSMPSWVTGDHYLGAGWQSVDDERRRFGERYTERQRLPNPTLRLDLEEVLNAK
jgi:hypothetical protein